MILSLTDLPFITTSIYSKKKKEERKAQGRKYSLYILGYFADNIH
jgi:hypothetical protein